MGCRPVAAICYTMFSRTVREEEFVGLHGLKTGVVLRATIAVVRGCVLPLCVSAEFYVSLSLSVSLFKAGMHALQALAMSTPITVVEGGCRWSVAVT